MASAPRTPADICYQLLTLINKEGKALKNDLIKNLGSEAAFTRWFDDFLVKLKIVECFQERIDGRTFTYYRKTADGEILHMVLIKRNLVKAVYRIIGRRRLKPD